MASNGAREGLGWVLGNIFAREQAGPGSGGITIPEVLRKQADVALGDMLSVVNRAAPGSDLTGIFQP